MIARKILFALLLGNLALGAYVLNLRRCHANVFCPRWQASWRTAFVGDSLTAGMPYPSTNYGTSGATSQKIRDIVASDVLCHCYKRIVLLAGTNDVLQGVPSAETLRNISLIVRAAQTDGLEVFICTLPPLSGIYVNKDNQAQVLSKGIEAIAEQQHAHLLDYRQALSRKDYSSVDGIHLTASSYDIIFHLLKGAGV